MKDVPAWKHLSQCETSWKIQEYCRRKDLAKRARLAQKAFRLTRFIWNESRLTRDAKTYERMYQELQERADKDYAHESPKRISHHVL